ncbi:MFS transporter [Sporobolomyces salmoneus]|uniref:MFS transporter n=1 Tax=Sporobolomyces salmoneus TaxID=183962 RepID=UPI00316CFE9A
MTNGRSTAEVDRVREREPLLAGHSSEEPKAPTPLPTTQVLVLCLMRFGEPIAFTVIFPFVARFLEDLHVTDDPSKIGYYAGAIESIFALTTFLTVLAWGRLSDRIGRKPVLLIGLLGVTISIIAFGLSQSFAALVISRCLGGALNGNVAVIKGTMGEITDESNQARAFSFLPLAWSLGSVIGPLLGGYLSHPAERFPRFFDYPFFVENPYVLPCLVGALFPFLGTLVGFFFLEETLKPSSALPIKPDRRSAKRHGRFVVATSTTVPAPPEQRRLLEEVEDPDSGYSTPAVQGSRDDLRAEITAEEMAAEGSGPVRPPPFKALFTKRVVAALTTYAFLALETVALDALLILFCYSPTRIGGLGFRESDIGTALSLSGLSAVAFQLLLFPPLQKRFGTVKLYQGLMTMYPIVFALFPVMSAVRHDRKAVWIVMVVFLLLKSIGNMSYACNMLVVTDSAPSKRLLGTLNGTAQMCSSLMRSIGPTFASSFFALSVSHNLAGGLLVFHFMIVLAVMAAASTLWLHEGGRASNEEEVIDGDQVER